MKNDDIQVFKDGDKYILNVNGEAQVFYSLQAAVETIERLKAWDKEDQEWE